MFGPIFKRRAPLAFGLPAAAAATGQPRTCSSHVMPRLSRRLASLPHPRVLDLGSLVGGNLQFFIDLGCRVTADDFRMPVETVAPDSRPANGSGAPAAGPRLEYPDETFDAVLAWELFDFLSGEEARRFSRDLLRVVRPGGIVMALFTSRETERREPPRRFRIVGPDQIEWIPVGASPSLRHVYQNRDIERMFEGFRTHTAFVLTNGTREMLLEKKAPGTGPTLVPRLTSRAPGLR